MTPENYALIEGGVVVNLLWLEPRNASDFPSSVRCGNEAVSIGDLYVDGAFVHLNAGGGGSGDPVEAENETEGEQPA